MEALLANIQSTFIFIAVLSVLIIVHEWGHFITAKKCGVQVDEFSLGFGPKLWSKFYNGTEYMVKAIPLGGYVRMAGDERQKCHGKPDEFFSKSVGARSLIVLNGPVVNFVLAYLSFILVFMIGYPGLSTKVVEIEKDGPAYAAGFQSGDHIVAIDGQPVYGWVHMDKLLEGSSAEPIEVTLKRNDQELTTSVVPTIASEPNMVGRLRDVRDLGVGDLSNIIGGVAEDYPAAEAGLQEGDRIIQVDNVVINDWTTLQKSIEESKNEKIVVKFVRDDQVMTSLITPKISMVKDEDGNEVESRKIGIGPQREFEMFRFGLIDSVRYAYEELVFITVLTYESLFRMITGAMSAKESVTGPVGIFYIVKGAAEEGISHLLLILGIISASLAIFNLLPVLPLDGGHLFLFGVEKLRGRALPAKIDDYIARVGFSLIILLALFVFYSDFARFGWIKAIKDLFSFS